MILGQTAGDEPKVVYSNQIFGGVQLATNGWGGQFYAGKYNGYRKLRLRGIELVKLKHPREYKINTSGGNNARKYAYGKINSFQSLRFLLGKKKIISDKLRHGAVSLGYSYSLGGNLGVLKPIYVEVRGTDPFSTTRIERYDPSIHEIDVVNGKASFLNGLTELKPRIGASAKFALQFEYSSENDRVQILEVGCAVDLFPSPIQMMIESVGNEQYFLNVYLGYSVGKKFVKR